MSGDTLVIVGAGLAGLCAAHAWPQAPILEAQPRPRAAHRALLRFRSDAVSRLTGIEFRRVLVRKGLWAQNSFAAPSIGLANAYSQKVVGRLAGERSVWKLDAVERFVAPDDFYEQLIAAVGSRIEWGAQADFSQLRTPCVNTAPLPTILDSLSIRPPPGVEFHRAPIWVSRWRVPHADAFQTVYFPERALSLYRASITGSTLIAESMGELHRDDAEAIERAFALRLGDCEPLDSVEQRYGKIVPLDDAARKGLLFRLTHNHHIYSLGRFATWRNILLDDVVDDIAAIKRLIRAESPYDIRRAAS
jgi:hypothetical protein